MCETIYVEKNKSSRFGIHFYNDSAQWQVFCENCGVTGKDIAVICSNALENEAWNAFAASCKTTLKLTAKDTDTNELRQFLTEHCDYTFIILSEPFILNAIQSVIDSDDSKISYVLVPVTPFSFFDAVSIKPKTDKNGEIICKELFPIGIYCDTSILLNASPKEFLGGTAAAFRLSISHKASMFEWMIYNLYELLDCEKAVVMELLNRGYNVHKERIEKDTAKERALPIYGAEFYNVLAKAGIDTDEADLWSLSMVCQSYLSWKSGLLSMEEYYEIRDMFVAFGLSISETEASDEELMNLMINQNSSLLNEKETVLIRKLGKMIPGEAPTKELIREAFAQIYYNESDND